MVASAPPSSTLLETALAQVEYLLGTLRGVPLDSISVFKSTADVHLLLLETLGYPISNMRRMVENIFEAANRYVEDFAQDPQALSLEMAFASLF